jgi:hypothetical protein
MPTVYSTTALPDVIGEDYEARRVMKTIRSAWETAHDQARALDGVNILWAFRIGWSYLQQSDAEKLLHAYEMLGADWSGMYWFDWVSQPWNNIFVAKSAGGVSAYVMPFKAGTSATTAVRAGGSTSAGTLQSGSGTNGEDVFNFNTVPANNADIRADFTARRRRKVRITSFRMSPRAGGASGLWTAAMELIETEASDL